MQEMWVGSLGREDSLQEGMATHSSTLAWRIPWTEEPGGLQSIRVEKSQTLLKRLSTHTVLFYWWIWGETGGSEEEQREAACPAPTPGM